MHFRLPTLAHSPTPGVDPFGPSGARFYTGWEDGGFFDLYGTLLRINMDAFFHGGKKLDPLNGKGAQLDNPGKLTRLQQEKAAEKAAASNAKPKWDDVSEIKKILSNLTVG